MGVWQGALEGMVMMVRKDFWSGKRVLLTGHTGFKGGWLVMWLQRLGANVTGAALPANTVPNLFELANVADGIASHYGDIRNAETLKEIVANASPDIVFHLAAQPLVRASYREPLATFASNVMGTANLLDALRGQSSVRSVVMVTTDKVYRNSETPFPYREDDPLGGHDPYSASKAASEIVVASYRDAFLASQGVAIASARAGNVIGGGDWSEDRLIPDAVRAWQANEVLEIRSPNAIRPWQHVLEPLYGYLVLAEKLWNEPESAGAYNFGPQTSEAATVKQVVQMARSCYGQGDVSYNEKGILTCHEAGWLALEIAKSRTVLNVTPKWTLAEAVDRTVTWYRALREGGSARSLCEADIAAYEVLA